MTFLRFDIIERINIFCNILMFSPLSDTLVTKNEIEMRVVFIIVCLFLLFLAAGA